jgi:hypothetical protein
MTHEPTEPKGEDGQAPDVSRRPTDAEVRAIAEQLVREVREPPTASPSNRVSARVHELSPAGEERVDNALVALGAVEPEHTLQAERESQEGEPPGAPRPNTSDREHAGHGADRGG